VALVLWLLGLTTTQLSDANFLPVNNEDDYLHLVLGVVMVAFGLLPSRRVAPADVRDQDRVGSRVR